MFRSGQDCHADQLETRQPQHECEPCTGAVTPSIRRSAFRPSEEDKASSDRATDRVNQAARLTVGPAERFRLVPEPTTQSPKSTYLRTIASEVVQGRAPAPEDVRSRRAAFPRVRSAESRRLAVEFCRPAVFERTLWRTRASVTCQCPKWRVSLRARRGRDACGRNPLGVRSIAMWSLRT